MDDTPAQHTCHRRQSSPYRAFLVCCVDVIFEVVFSALWLMTGTDVGRDRLWKWEHHQRVSLSMNVLSSRVIVQSQAVMWYKYTLNIFVCNLCIMPKIHCERWKENSVGFYGDFPPVRKFVRHIEIRHGYSSCWCYIYDETCTYWANSDARGLGARQSHHAHTCLSACAIPFPTADVCRDVVGVGVRLWNLVCQITTQVAVAPSYFISPRYVFLHSWPMTLAPRTLVLQPGQNIAHCNSPTY